MKTILKGLCVVVAGLVLFVAIDTGLFMMKDYSLRTRAIAVIENGKSRSHRVTNEVSGNAVSPSSTTNDIVAMVWWPRTWWRIIFGKTEKETKH